MRTFEPERRISLLLVDDHPLVREGIRTRLETVPHFKIVGEASNAEQALVIATERRPALALVDIGLRGVNGIELTRRISASLPAIFVLILSMYDDHEYVVQAIRAGARGYVTKDSPAEEVVAAVKVVASGGTFYSGSAVAAAKASADLPMLTHREREILVKIVEGGSSKEIAEVLRLSVRTVESHRQNIRRKLGAENTADLVRRALRLGLG